MKIPFLHRKPEDIASIARRATYVGSAEVVVPPHPRPTKTLEDTLRARARINALRNGAPPS